MQTVHVNFENTPVSIKPGESLLNAALRQGLEIPNSCQSGMCQTCLVKVSAGIIPAVAQQGLNPQQKRQNYALACQLKPTTSLTAGRLDHSSRHPARVVDRTLLNRSVLRLRLETEIDWFPGQYLTLWKNAATGRPYSIASLPVEGFLEFHIKRHAHGLASTWLHEEVSTGAELTVSDPRGECFYQASLAAKPLLLAGVGTGLAPLYGIARDALQQGHKPDIILYAGARNRRELYMVDELHRLANLHPGFHYRPVLREQGPGRSHPGDIVEAIQQRQRDLRGWSIFLCGAPKVVSRLQRYCFLNGASLRDIHADPFITAQYPANALSATVRRNKVKRQTLNE